MARATGSTAAPGGARRGTRWAGSPARQELVREHNLSLVLTTILEPRTPVTRAQVAQATGLTRATVSDLVESLVAGRLVKELTPRAGDGAGRPGVPLAPADRTVVGVGAEVAVDHIGVTVVDLTGLPVTQRVVEGDFWGSDAEATLARLGTLVRQVVARVTALGMEPAGVCVGVPGLTDHRTGLLRFAPNLGWRDVAVLDLVREASGLTDLPWTVGNDADLAARAELRARARRTATPALDENFVYIGGFVGIGGAVVRAGTPALGTNGWGAEIGHSCVHPDGPACTCGANGCLEQYAGRRALFRRADLPEGASVDELLRRAATEGAAGDAARLALDEAADALGRAASTMVNIVDVDTVVLGGFYAALFDHVADRIRSELDHRVLGSRWSGVRLERALVDELATLHGAALSVLAQVLSAPASWGGRTVTIP